MIICPGCQRPARTAHPKCLERLSRAQGHAQARAREATDAYVRGIQSMSQQSRDAILRRISLKEKGGHSER